MKYLENFDCYIMHPLKTYNEVSFKGEEYNSMNNVVTQQELKNILAKQDFYK